MTEGKINITANVISFLYVGFATLTIACIPPGEQFSGDWTLGGIFYTLPVSVVGASMVRYNPSLLPYALAVQVLFFFLFRWLVKRCLRYYVNEPFRNLEVWTPEMSINENSYVHKSYNLDLLAGDALPVSDIYIEELFETIVMVRDYAIQHKDSELNEIAKNEMFDGFIMYAIDAGFYGTINDMDPAFDTAAFIKLCKRLHAIIKKNIEEFETLYL